MRRAALVMALVVIFGNILPSPNRVNGEDSPAPLDLPAAEAPFGLDSATLPNTQAEVTALFARLPVEVEGMLRSLVPDHADGRLVATFGEPDPTFGPRLTLQALTFAEGDFFPRDFTAGRFAAAAVRSSDHDVTVFGRDGDLVWVRAETTAAVEDDDPGTPALVRPLHTLAWGAVDSSWLFTASAFESENLETLVTVFVTATADVPSSATPVASPAVHRPRR